MNRKDYENIMIQNSLKLKLAGLIYFTIKEKKMKDSQRQTFLEIEKLENKIDGLQEEIIANWQVYDATEMRRRENGIKAYKRKLRMLKAGFKIEKI